MKKEKKKLLPWPDLPPARSMPKNILSQPHFTKQWMDGLRCNASDSLLAWMEDKEKNPLPKNELEDYLKKNPAPSFKDWVAEYQRSHLSPIKIPKVCRESQNRAMEKLIQRANGIKPDANGVYNGDEFTLNDVQAYGPAARAAWRGHLRGLWAWQEAAQRDPNAQVELKKLQDREVNFLKALGRALSDKSKRRALPDWKENVTLREQYLVNGWCDRIVVDGEKWPPLCCLSYPALAKFLTLTKNPTWLKVHNTNLPCNPLNLKQEVTRLGLKPIPRDKIQSVEKRSGEFVFG